MEGSCTGRAMPKGLQSKGALRQDRLLRAAIRLFLENGYEKTTTAAIAREAGMSPTAFFAFFENKEALLLLLVQTMFHGQFSLAEELLGKDSDPVLLYAAETTLQLQIAELSEPLRELYVAAYSLPSTTDYIYDNTCKKLAALFRSYLPSAGPQDFYELEIATASITRGFMAKPCGLYFTFAEKVRRHLDCCLTLYQVPPDRREDAIHAALHMRLQPVAEHLVAAVLRRAEEGFTAAPGRL